MTAQKKLKNGYESAIALMTKPRQAARNTGIGIAF
jgi:hypothetical protein